MTVSVLIITHGNIGKSLLKAVKSTLGTLPLPARAIAIKGNVDPDTFLPKLRKICQQHDQGDGVLVLTDMFGSTPSNLSQALKDEENIKVVAGLNLPMLIRVMNYPELKLAQLKQKAFSGGRDGVFNCDGNHDQEKNNNH